MPKRNPPSSYHALAEARGFSWIGPEVRSTMHKTGWQCRPKGCIWYAPYNNIQKGGGCPICNKRSHRTDEAYHDLAKDHRIGWLGPNTPDRDFQTNWICRYGHMWNASYNQIDSGMECPCAECQ